MESRPVIPAHMAGFNYVRNCECVLSNSTRKYRTMLSGIPDFASAEEGGQPVFFMTTAAIPASCALIIPIICAWVKRLVLICLIFHG